MAEAFNFDDHRHENFKPNCSFKKLRKGWIMYKKLSGEKYTTYKIEMKKVLSGFLFSAKTL